MASEEQIQTTEIQPQAAFMPVDLSVLSERLKYVEAFVKDIMKPDTDYGVIPGTGNKPALFKPGAEKLQFAFNLQATYDVVREQFDPHVHWSWEWTKKSTSEVFTGSEIGFYRFQVRCTLTNRTTGEIWGSAIGECDSSERGREAAPSNTVLKMAEKRAHVAAILNATFTSDRFTQDVEDLRGNQSVGSTGGGSDQGFPAKYDTWCTICGKKHPVGTKVVKHGKNSKGKDGYAAVACLPENAPPKDQADPVTPETPPATVTTAEGSEVTALLASIERFEELFRNLTPDNDDELIDALRQRKAGAAELCNANEYGLKNYHDYLVDEVGVE